VFKYCVADLITQGYKVVSRGEAFANLIKKKKASVGMHILILLLIGWWTFLIPNILYQFIRSTQDDVLVRLQKET
jgi:hypothetical protein